MNHAHQTFALIDEIRNSEFYNGLLSVKTAGEMKQLVKRQIADFVGEKLNDVVRPIKSEVQEVLAELKTLRKEMAPAHQADEKTELYLRTMRFLLDDKHADFRKFCEVIANDLDAAVPLLIQEQDFDHFVAAFGYKIIVEDNKEAFDEIMRQQRTVEKSHRLLSAVHSLYGWWAVFDDNSLVVNTRQLQKFKAAYAALRGNLRLS